MHLATKLVIKEHRLRYQKEQFDRFFTSQSYPDFVKENIKMSEYAKEYARMIETLVSQSHNGKCPKIEANYDDFNEQPEDVDIVATKSEDPTYLAIDREHNQKLKNEDETLEGLKRGLQADINT